MFKIFKDLIGKDISRIALPVYLNEPVSILQKFCEIFDYKNLLDKASQEQDEFKRLAYVFSIDFMNLSQSIGRMKKPFNPLLGETVEFIKDDLFVIFEQVSHHPPISALYGENDHFQIWCHLEPKTKFKFTKLEISPKHYMAVYLKKTKEKFVYSWPQASIHNLLKGDIYVWNFGQMSCLNVTTGSRAVIKLKDHTIWSKLDHTCGGDIRDAEGTYSFYLF